MNLDDKISLWILNNTDVFENIHPNYITGIGLITNFIIFHHLIVGEQNDLTLIFLLFLRWIVDCLDGNVARKYKKTSKFGNIFDGTSDMILNAILIHFFCSKINNNNFTQIIISLVVIYAFYIIYCKKFFVTHKNIKNGNNWFDKINAFAINNSFILYIAIFFCIKNINKIKSLFEQKKN